MFLLDCLRQRTLVVFTLLLLLFVLPSTVSTAILHTDSAAVTEIQIDRFIAYDYAEFWWDSTAIPGCALVLIKRDNVEVATVACSTQPWRSQTLQANNSYTFRFYFQDAEGKTIGNALGVGAYVTAGTYSGTLHTNATIAGVTADVGRVEVAENGSLMVQSGVTLTGGDIYDFTGTSADCSSRAGSVLATGATFQGTEFHLCSFTSALQNNAGNATVNLLAAAKVQGNTLGLIRVTDSSGGTVALQDNVFPSGDVTVYAPSEVYISKCEFGQGQVLFQSGSSGTVEASKFTSTGESAIKIQTNRDVSVLGNEITVKNAASTATGVYIVPQASTSAQPKFTLSLNTIIGPDSGRGVYVAGTGNGSANISILQNTISRFEYGVLLQRNATVVDPYTAIVNGNSIVNSSKYALYTALNGGSDSVVATGNCFADNGDYAIGCQTVNTIDATGNYWGHETGPRVNSNPDGRGEGVYCKDIDVSNWLTEHACAVAGLDISGIEVVQSVQTIDNQVELVENKPTVVRVYPSVTSGTATVQGELTGFRDGQQLGPIPSQFPARATVIDDWDKVRAENEASLNFRLPPTWLNGKLNLVATLDAVPEASSSDVSTPTLQTTIEFSPIKKLKIAYIPLTVTTGPKTYPVNAGDILDVHNDIVSVYPLADVEYVILPEYTAYYSGLPTGLYGRLTSYSFVHYSKQAKSFIEELGDFEADIYLTVHAVDVNSMEYRGAYDKNDLSVAACSTQDHGAGCLSIVGARLGLRFIVTANPQTIPPYMESYTWPYEDGMIHEFGYDVEDGVVRTPDDWDVMSQEAAVDGLASWISPFHYKRAYEKLRPEATPASAAATGSAFWVTGVTDGQVAHLYPVRALNGLLPNVTQENGSGAYCVQSVGAGNAIKDTYCFDLITTNPFSGADSLAYFGVLLTQEPGIQSVRLRTGGKTLASLSVPPSQPSVSIQNAAYDSTYHSVQVAWTVPSGDPANLRYTFLYSADNGATWTPIGVHPDPINWYSGAFHWGAPATMVEPGAQARIRILATDGFHTAEVTSAAFNVPDLGPRVGIDEPDNNAVLDQLPVQFSGYAWDVHDGNRASAIQWSSNKDGKLGTGDSLQVESLSDGTHVITLTATDIAGHTSSAEIRITVGLGTPPPSGSVSVFLPILLR